MESKRKVTEEEVNARISEVKSVFERFMTTYLFLMDSSKHAEIEDATQIVKALDYITEEVKDKLENCSVKLFVNKEAHKIWETDEERIFEVIDTHIVEDRKVEKTFFIKTTYRIILRREDKKQNVQHVFDGIEIKTKELIDENTPFTEMLKEELSFAWFREPWLTNVIETLFNLAEAERNGRLDEELAKVIENAESEPVLENKLLLNAIARAKKKYSEFMKRLKSGQMP
ncbi:MAG: hypothetical protein JHC26_07880 [Thermofilum sp.]|jgi:hypothetical protein|uniref:hypothetical protein n=1 Tax=Thermofilum sp. TaxID=1961369 RepID=UPI002583F38D|nr:hypothetical protein [Thermofilum sp.]MCI4408996.1 hypothetical protein [Thermofilum sp.]